VEFKNNQLELEALGFPMWLNYADYYSHCLSAMRLLCKEPFDLFSRQEHRDIHEAYKYLLANGAAPNEANIKNQLMKQDKWHDGFSDIMEEMLWHGKGTMSMEAGMTGHQFMEFLLHDLRPLRWRRNFRDVVVRVSERIDEANEATFRDIALDHVAEIQLAYTDSTEIKDSTPKSFQEAVNIAIDEEEMLKELGRNPSLDTGFRDIDWLTGGYKPGDLVVLAGRTSMGKSAMALDIALNTAQQKEGVIVFSLEMTNTENIRRLLAKINHERDNVISSSAKKAETQLNNYLEFPFYLDDSPASPTDIELRCEEIANSLPVGKRIGLIVIDHLQLLGIKDQKRYESRNRQLSAYTSELKALAKKFKCVVLALSQVNRTSQREQRAPALSDLRESGTIEENADIVIGIYRPGVDRQDANPHKAEAVILKNRHGAIGQVELAWNPNLARFTNGGNV